jgi:quercetin dioxygenase-like cupin family protein
VILERVPARPEVVDLSPFLDAEGDGVHWTLAEPGDLNVNLVRLGAHRTIGEHVNDALDVVVVVLAGSGELVVDGVGLRLEAVIVAQIPKGTVRAIHADAGGLAYLTVHRRRDPLGITDRR